MRMDTDRRSIENASERSLASLDNNTVFTTSGVKPKRYTKMARLNIFVLRKTKAAVEAPHRLLLYLRTAVQIFFHESSGKYDLHRGLLRRNAVKMSLCIARTI